MDAADLHRKAIIVDGLIIAKWSREVFQNMRVGGLILVGKTLLSDIVQPLDQITYSAISPCARELYLIEI